MEKKLKVSHVRIQNVLGIAELEFAPGGFTRKAREAPPCPDRLGSAE